MQHECLTEQKVFYLSKVRECLVCSSGTCHGRCDALLMLMANFIIIGVAWDCPVNRNIAKGNGHQLISVFFGE